MLLLLASVELPLAFTPGLAKHFSHSSGTPRRWLGCRATLDDVPPHARLVLVRHGQSEWNLANRFTGWVDVDLTEQGIAEAREAGRLLAAEGLLVDEVHTSFMRRAIRSAVLMLSTLNQCWVPVHKDPRLKCVKLYRGHVHRRLTCCTYALQ